MKELKHVGLGLVFGLFPPSGLAQTQHPAGIHEYRAGSVPLTALETTKAVTFSAPMLDTNYAIMLSGGAAATPSWSGKTAAGFTMILSVGLSGRVDYMCLKLQ